MPEPRLLVTPGDPRGIGPEVTLAALAAFRSTFPAAVVSLVGPEGELPEEALSALGAEARERAGDDAHWGDFAAASIERAARELLAGRGHAVVTGPVHKPSLHAAGRDVPGVTELLGSLSGAERVGMLMAAEETRLGGPLRVLLATTHLPLRDVPHAITAELVDTQLRLLLASLREGWAMEQPRVGVCGLNPHASDGGLFGDEEERILRPVIERVREDGFDATGPWPADTVFTRALEGGFDAVLAPYHDVGMAAFKTAAFGTGVNVTLGLPFVRTSPDHGTAFEIAGTGRARHSSMLRALRLARELAANRFDTAEAHV